MDGAKGTGQRAEARHFSRSVAIQSALGIVRPVPGKLRRDGRVVEGARLERV